MSERLADALVRMAEATAERNPDEPALLAVDGIDIATAEAMARKWTHAADGFTLKVVAPSGCDLGEAALGDEETATSVRNDEENYPRGAFLVVCEGQRIPDRQSVKGLDPVDPIVFLADEEHWNLLVRGGTPVDDAEATQIGEALRSLDPAERPRAVQVAEFLDALAGDGVAGGHLPLLGAFHDDRPISPGRLVDNLQLAASLKDQDTFRAGAVRDIKERAIEQLGEERAERVLALLYGNTRALLDELNYEQAYRILREPPAKDLPDAVKDQIRIFANRVNDDGIRSIVEDLLLRAEDLRDRSKARDAADDLLAFHEDYRGLYGDVFRDETQKRLRQLRRTSKTSAGYSVERGLIKAIDSVGKPVAVEVRSPDLPESVERETDAKAVLAYAALRLRAEPLFAVLREAGINVSGVTEAALYERVDEALKVVDRPRDGLAPTITIAVRGEGRGNVHQVTWTPSSEDLVLVMVNHRFCNAGTDSLVAHAAPGAPLNATGLLASNRTSPLSSELRKAATAIAERGYTAHLLRRWSRAWAEAVDLAKAGPSDRSISEALTVVGCVEFTTHGSLLLTHLHPLKAEWLASRTDAWVQLLQLLLTEQALRRDVLAAAEHLASANASQYPAFLWYGPGADPLVPGVDGTVVSVFGGIEAPSNINPPPVASVEQVLDKLVDLHRETQPHVRVAALGNHACDLALRAVVGRLGLERRPFERAEVTFIGGEPSDEALRTAEQLERASSRSRLKLRYVESIDDLKAGRTPQVHLAVVSGLGERASGRNVRFGEAAIVDPAGDPDPLFAPKTWLRVNRSEQILLCPPGVTPTYSAHLAVQAAPREGWREADEEKAVPTLAVDIGGVQRELDVLHDYAQWVLTVDRYAARDTLERLLRDSVAILHQERRTSGSVTEGLIISQRSGGAADRAIARALANSGIETNETVVQDLAKKLRAGASRGHGVLALRAATTGSGINELIGHVAGFAELTRRASPQPIPTDSRLVLISLDEYQAWFGRGKRADLLVLALPQDAEDEVWAANVEVKAVLSGGDQRKARREAKTQLQETLKDSKPAIRADGSLFSRMWLNRIVEAAVSVVRENNVRLSEAELNALNRFRSGGTPSKDWGGIGLVFGDEELPTETPHALVDRDRIPLFLYGVKLDRDLLLAAAETNPADLKTASGLRRELRSSTKDRARRTAGIDESRQVRKPPVGDDVALAVVHEVELDTDARRKAAVEEDSEESTNAAKRPPIIGLDVSTGEPVEWRVTGEGALNNGHVEIYGQSGFGKTQFVKSLLAQLHGSGANYTVCDFKDDYGRDQYGTFFPDVIGARYFNLAKDAVPFNPMAGHNSTKRDMQSFCIELRDMVDIAAKPYVRMGPRQLGKLLHALEEAFEYARLNARKDPKLEDVGAVLDADLEGIIGDLFRFEFFGDGPPFGDLVEDDTIFNFDGVPGRGLTQDLLAGFVLSSFYLRMAAASHVHSTVNFAVVVDEAHRVANYKAIRSMVSEQRSKGVAVILATQKPGQLPPEVETNAQTKVFLRLPGTAANDAARRLDPSEKDLPELIRNLQKGEAFVSIGDAPRLVRLRQFWRDDQASL